MIRFANDGRTARGDVWLLSHCQGWRSGFHFRNHGLHRLDGDFGKSNAVCIASFPRPEMCEAAARVKVRKPLFTMPLRKPRRPDLPRFTHATLATGSLTEVTAQPASRSLSPINIRGLAPAAVLMTSLAFTVSMVSVRRFGLLPTPIFKW